METISTTIALEMTGLDVASLSRPDEAVLVDVNWTVTEADYWAIAGLQGSGKTDLLFTAAGLVPPLRGYLRVLGREIWAGQERELLASRLAVGLVFDGGRLLSELSLGENVALPLQYHLGLALHESIERAASLLEFVGLADYTSRMPGSLNRNLQQRAGLARALALKPRVLLLDKPLTGLDPRDAWWWLDFMDALAAGHAINDNRPLTIVTTGDDLRPWQTRARRFAILSNQHFVNLGGREDLAAHPEPSLQELLRR